MTVASPELYPDLGLGPDSLWAPSALREGQFALGTMVWGDGTELIVEDGSMPMPAIRDEDVDNFGSHGGRPGRDLLGTTTWDWALATDTQDFEVGPRNALLAFEDLAQMWRAGIDLPPGSLMALRYHVFGRTRRVYGRPRRYDGPQPNYLAKLGQARGAIDFKIFDPFTYDDTERGIMIARVAPQGGGGLAWPFTWPAQWGTTPNQRLGLIDVGGTAPTPFRAEFFGPVTDPWIEGAGFLIALQGTIPDGDSVMVDTREKTILRGGTNVRGMLRRRSRLGARLPRGTSQVSYGGTDSTNLSKVAIRWRPAYRSI